MNIKEFLRRVLVSLGLKADRPKVYKRDAHLDRILPLLVSGPNAFIIAVETKQAMMRILTHAEKHHIPALGVFRGDPGDLGHFRHASMTSALKYMHYRPESCQIVVLTKNTATLGWATPLPYSDYWPNIHMLSTFPWSAPWRTHFERRRKVRP